MKFPRKNKFFLSLGFVTCSLVFVVGCAVKPLPLEMGNPKWGLEVTWHGHSCFTLEDSVGRTLVIDPFDETVGYGRIKLLADALLITHHHFDHDNRRAVKPRLKDLDVVDSTGHALALGDERWLTLRRGRGGSGRFRLLDGGGGVRPHCHVVSVDVDQFGIEVREFRLGIDCIGGHDQEVAPARLVRRRAIDRYRARTPLGGDDKRGEPLAVVHVVDVDLLVRALSMGKLHHAMMGTAAVAIGTAAAITGTLVNLAAGGIERNAVRFGHPSGTLRVGAEASLVNGEWKVNKAIMSRSARVLMEGFVRVPGDSF